MHDKSFANLSYVQFCSQPMVENCPTQLAARKRNKCAQDQPWVLSRAVTNPPNLEEVTFTRCHNSRVKTNTGEACLPRKINDRD